MKKTHHTEFLVAFGVKLREVRKSKGLTQEALSYMCDMELSTLNRIELGKANTSLAQVKAISNAIKIHPKLLFDFEIQIE